jgi:hypothetical protein
MHRIGVVATSLVCAAWLAAAAVADEPVKPSGTEPAKSSAVEPAKAASTQPVAVGAPINVKKPVKIAQLAKQPGRFLGKTILIEGKVKAVCQGMGCWVEVEDAKGASFLAKSLDESVLLPKDCAGRTIAVQGVVTRLDAKAHDHEHASAEHECPQPTFLVSTQGAALK